VKREIPDPGHPEKKKIVNFIDRAIPGEFHLTYVME
jgi:hypothetical protein